MKIKNKVKILLLFLIFAVIIFDLLFAVLINKEEHYDLRDINAEYAGLKNSVVATVDGNEITDRDLCIIKYLYGEKDCLDIAVKQKSVKVLAEKDGFYLTSQDEYKETKYACDNYSKLNLEENTVNTEFKNDLIENQIDLAVLYEYRLLIKKQINDGEFNCDIKSVNLKYNIFKSLNEGDKYEIPFEIKWAIIDDIADDYIDWEIRNLEIEYEK